MSAYIVEQIMINPEVIWVVSGPGVEVDFPGDPVGAVGFVAKLNEADRLGKLEARRAMKVIK